MACTTGAPQPPVRPGIVVLLEDSSHLLADRRIGLLTNHTGIDADGRQDLERLLDAGAQVTAIFSPEHGYGGTLDLPAIGQSIDSATGLTIFSLYGATREPTPEMLAAIDLLLVDLQDIGARPYTYVSTMLLAMRACAASGVPVVVLDRPNPIDGEHVQGPVLEPEHRSFVGMLEIPMRHGLTMGELARVGIGQLGLTTELTVVPASGWTRDRWFDETDLPWVRPSPSMPDLESATHYPGTVIFEATNLSVGRGTPVAFQVIGAPWLDPAGIVDRVGDKPGVTMRDTSIVPLGPPDGKFADTEIRAIKLHVTDRSTYDPVALAVHLLDAISQQYPDQLTVTEDRLARLIGTGVVWERLQSGVGAEQIVAGWREHLEAYRADRRPALLYH